MFHLFAVEGRKMGEKSDFLKMKCRGEGDCYLYLSPG